MTVCVLCAVVSGFAQPAPAPVRLAIVVSDPSIANAGDVLTAELSQLQNVQLLERSRIEAVWREQELSARGGDFLRLGQVLGADGLLLMELVKGSTSSPLSIQLVAVNPGVLLSAERFAWPIRDLAQWSAGIAAHLGPFLPKLDVLAKDALPISVVNLRSTIQSSQSRELERELTLLTIDRLSREKELFVLERRRMHLMSDEKLLTGLDDTAFWDGSYLLDGVLDRSGFTQTQLTISARLVPPGQGTPLQIEVSGSRTNTVEVINRLAEAVVKALALKGGSEPWNPEDEANQYFSEARWALKWGLFAQAQAAAESSWALGRRTPETAQFLVRTYVESIPDEPGNGTDVHVLQVPNASAFPVLDRALEFVAQHHDVLFEGTNSVESFRLGFRLLREAFGQLESYYYAAERRSEQGDELLSLRSKTRQMIQVMDAKSATLTNVKKWDDPRVAYARLRWIEGGVAFERPEEALVFYRDLLAGGATAEGLPRIVGWTWPDRRRVSVVRQQLAQDARAGSNAVTRLEGLFLTLLLAPEDEAGSLPKAEEQLIGALWENRELLWRDERRATVVERTRKVLQKKLDDESIYEAFSHEPFAGFKHRLRLGFLTSPNNTNLAVLDELFPNTNVRMETPEQARELLPLMEALPQNPALIQRLQYKLSILRNTAGVAAPQVPSQLAVDTATVVDAKFVPWKLSRRMDSNRVLRFDGMVHREGKLWVRVRYLGAQDADVGGAFPASYLAVEPENGVAAEIVFPEHLGYASRVFEVSSNALYAVAGDRLFQYEFREKRWTRIAVSMEGVASLVWLNGRLFVGRSEGLLAVTAESGTVEVLASSRRVPPVNEVDSLWAYRTGIFPLSNGKLGAWVEENLVVFDPATDRWEVRPFPIRGKPGYMLTADFYSASGAQRLLTGPYVRRYLVGFWNEGPMESLLMEETQMPLLPPSENLLPPVRWDWSKSYPIEHSQIVADGRSLWVLTPRRLEVFSQNREPVKFADERDATLFCFTPESRAPLTVPVRFPTVGVTNLMIVNGQRTSVLDASNFDQMMILQRLQRHVGNMAFWHRVPGGLVLAGPRYCGHWFIPDTILEKEFAQQRNRRLASATSSDSKTNIPEKP